MHPDFDDSLDDLFGLGSSEPRKALPAGFEKVREAAPLFAEQCPKCKGCGRFISYSGRDCGPCFACKGNGKHEFKTSPEARAQARTSAADRKARSEQANLEAFKASQPTAFAWLEAKRPTFAFAADVYAKIAKYGDLHEGTLAAVLRCVARDEERDAQRAAKQAEAKAAAPVDVASIVELFDRAAKAGLKRFTLRFNRMHFQVDRNKPNLIWVSEAGYGTAKLGRIENGIYKPGYAATPEVIARLVEIVKDPLAAGIAYSQLTSSCSVCGRHLENQDSVDAGIGPICAGRLNRPGLKFERAVAGEDF
jgi:hypothetical protein